MENPEKRNADSQLAEWSEVCGHLGYVQGVLMGVQFMNPRFESVAEAMSRLERAIAFVRENPPTKPA